MPDRRIKKKKVLFLVWSLGKLPQGRGVWRHEMQARNCCGQTRPRNLEVSKVSAVSLVSLSHESHNVTSKNRRDLFFAGKGSTTVHNEPHLTSQKKSHMNQRTGNFKRRELQAWRLAGAGGSTPRPQVGLSVFCTWGSWGFEACASDKLLLLHFGRISTFRPGRYRAYNKTILVSLYLPAAPAPREVPFLLGFLCITR